ncbi:MAG: hypothetical protein RL662_1747 [Bacteroidota bacterium]|jgi:hypothetical protein
MKKITLFLMLFCVLLGTVNAQAKLKFEFEDLPNKASGGVTTVQEDIGVFKWSNGKQSWWHSAPLNSTLEYTFEIPSAGNYRSDLKLTLAKNYSTFRVYVNGKFQSVHEGFYAFFTESWGDVELVSLGVANFKQGTNTIKFEIIGKDKDSNYTDGHMVGFDYFEVDTSVKLAKPQEYIQRVSLIGSAEPNAGWDLHHPKRNYFSSSKSVYEFEILLTPGQFKFVGTGDGTNFAWNPSICPLSNQVLEPNKTYDIQITNGAQDDYFFTPKVEGRYRLTVDLVNKKLIVGERTDVLYIFGDAVGSKETEMYRYDNNFFRAYLPLTKGHFKFVEQIGNAWNFIVPARAAHENIIYGYPHKVSNPYQGDYRFNMVESKKVLVSLDLNSREMYARECGTEKSLIYLVGDATPNGWNNNQPTPMDWIWGGHYEYIWKGVLKKGQFKFISKPGTWISLLPEMAANENVIFNYPHKISNEFKGDYRFNIHEDGIYTITLNLPLKQMTVTPEDTTKDQLYLVGEATAGGWDKLKATPMNKVETGNFRWTGTLKKGYFKFLTTKNGDLYNWVSLQPIEKAHQAVEMNDTIALSHAYRGDYFFVIPRDGEYTIDVNIPKMSMLVGDAPVMRTSVAAATTSNLFTVTSSYGAVKVATNGNTVERAELFNLSGKSVALTTNAQGDLTLGNALPLGTYIVRIVHSGNQAWEQKVIIK